MLTLTILRWVSNPS